MSENPFLPKVYQAERHEFEGERPVSFDHIGSLMRRVEQYLVIVLLFLLPVFFVPGLPASLGFDKVMVATSIGLLLVVLLGLSALRYRSVTTVIPKALLLFWTLVGFAFVSGVLSGDIQDALRGSVFEPQTAGFLAVAALLMTVPLVLQQSIASSKKALLALCVGAGLVIIHTVARLFVEGSTLSFQSFSSITTSPVGSFNDVAILSALVTVIGLITLLQYPPKKWLMLGTALAILLALMVLAIVNFFHLWVVIGFFGLLLLVYIFARDTLFGGVSEAEKQLVSPLVIIVTMVVCVVSIAFVVAGDYLGSRINAATTINYLEVRPSFTATIDIARHVYQDDLLFGIGPNRFSDAWRYHKDVGINQTIFWNTNFSAGFGYIPTLFITLGMIGGVLTLLFHVLYLRLGYRMLLRGRTTDPFWYYFGTVTFVGAVFLWGMSYVYVSGATILLLAALLTGMSFVAYQALVPEAATTIPLVSSRRRGFFLMTIVIIVTTAAVAGMFTMGRQYVAQADFTIAQVEATSVDEFEQLTQVAYQRYPDDVFVSAIAQAKLLDLRAMLTIQEPTKEDQDRFVTTAVAAVAAAEEAIRLDQSNPTHHATLANILIVLAGAGFADAENRATGKLEDARFRDPKNPSYDMLAAYMAVQLGDTAHARQKIQDALALKNNFSEALFLLTQLDVQGGNLESAIASARQIVTLEPNNPTRFYQLGVLLAAHQDLDGAIAAYEAAVARDPNFANARYMLALSYLDAKRLEDALRELRIVAETNQDNEQLRALITQLETTGLPTTLTSDLDGAVNEATPETSGDGVTSPTDPGTDLVSPVNTVGSDSRQETEGTSAVAPLGAGD